MRVYISGGITGLPKAETRERFYAAEELLRKAGHEPVNPMRLHIVKKDWKGYMLTDIEALMTCEAIYMLEGWINSKGAKIEFCIATEMDLTIIHQEKHRNLVYRTRKQGSCQTIALN